VRRPGDDVTIIAAIGAVRALALAADRLAERGIEAEVIDLRTLRPLDEDGIVALCRAPAGCRRRGWPADGRLRG